jgi:chromosome segregation ATPase
MDEQKFGVMLEKISGDIAKIVETQSLIPAMRDDIETMKKDMSDLKGQNIVLEEIARAHSDDLRELKTSVKRIDIRLDGIETEVKKVRTRLSFVEGDTKEIKGYIGTHHEEIVELKTASHSH